MVSIGQTDRGAWVVGKAELEEWVERGAGGTRERKEVVLSPHFHVWVTGVRAGLARAGESRKARLELLLCVGCK